MLKRLTFITLLLTLGIHAQNWNQWRGPDQDGVTEIKNLAVEWGNDTNIAWKTKLPGPGSSQPVVWGKKVFITSWSGYNPAEKRSKEEWAEGFQDQVRFHVTCLDAATGSQLWTKELKSMNKIVQEARNVKHHGLATHTPYVDADRLYVSFGTAGLFCFDHDGNEIWRASIGEKFSGWGSTPSLLLHENKLIVNASVESGALLAIDKETGKEIWKQTEGMDWEKAQKPWYDRSWATPLLFQIDGKWRIALLVVGQHLQVYDPETGKILWKVARVSGGYACSTPVYDPETKRLYCFAGGSHGVATASAIQAEDDAKGNRIIWKHAELGSSLIPPVLVNGRLYYAAYGGVKPKTAESIGALDPETGKAVFQVKPDELRKQTLVYATTFAGDGKVYIQTGKKGTYVLDATTPEFKVLSINKLDAEKTEMALGGRKTPNADVFNAAPVPLPNGRLIIRSYWGVYCIKAANE